MDFGLWWESWGIDREACAFDVRIHCGGSGSSTSEGKFGLFGPFLLLLGRGCMSRGGG